ncbi:exonuclease domain-containing protein [Corynebacterium striatum]|uniref:3'-5' exonuclease n=1 Tax=Corynebacterium striatum TaxID=43770 RepID=UPI001A2A3C5B|nr:3'-5' exonuclease [Corynebacterium striatum]
MGLFDRFVQHLDWQRPDPRTRLEDLPLLAVDMETTSLDPREGAIVSIGWVPINGGVIDLGGADYVLIKGATAGQIEQSVHIHMLTQDVVDAGVAEKEGISRLREALQGRVLLAHFAALEVGFLKAACKRIYGAAPRLGVVDTFALERRHMERMATYPRGEDLRLARVRQRYGLPNYGNHNALSDAQACAELFLAMRHDLAGMTLKQVVAASERR